MPSERPATCDPQAHAEYNAHVARMAFDALGEPERLLIERVCKVSDTLSQRGDPVSMQAAVDLLVAVARYTASRITDKPQEF